LWGCILSSKKLSGVYSLGRFTYAVDIFCENKFMKARDAFVDKCLPATDTKRRGLENVIAKKVIDLLPYFYHALYVRD
jgi:hypothetical protein